MVDALAVSCSASDQPARVDTRSPACQPPGERDPPGMEAQEVRRQRQLHDARRRRRRAGAADEEDDASLEGLLCESEDRLCRKLQDMQARGLHVQAVVRKSDLPRCHENGGWYANARQTCSHHGSLGRDDTFSGRSGAWTQCVTLATEAGATRPDRCYVLPPSTSVRPRCCITLQTDRTAK